MKGFAKALLLFPIVSLATAQVNVQGELRRWHRVTLTFTGPQTSEDTYPNPFRDYRLDVTFKHERSGKTRVVPGFYAVDGNAAESSAVSGDKWRVYFAPDEQGEWTYAVSFRTGKDVAIEAAGSGTPLPPDGTRGTLKIGASNKK